MAKHVNLASIVKETIMKDAGVKYSDMYSTIDHCPSKKEEIVYPNLYLNNENAPDLNGYEVGDDIILIIKGKVSSHSLNESDKLKKRESYDIKIEEIGCAKKKGEKYE